MNEDKFKAFQKMWLMFMVIFFSLFLFFGLVGDNIMITMLIGIMILFYYTLMLLEEIEYKIDRLIK